MVIDGLLGPVAAFSAVCGTLRNEKVHGCASLKASVFLGQR